MSARRELATPALPIGRRSLGRPRARHLPSRDGFIVYADHAGPRVVRPELSSSGLDRLFDRADAGLLEEWQEAEARRARGVFTVVADATGRVRSGEAPHVTRSSEL